MSSIISARLRSKLLTPVAAMFVVLLIAPPAMAQVVNVSPNTDERVVCSGIYGANFPDKNPSLASAVGFSSARWGGNRATRYNYVAKTSCSGIDYGEDANGAPCFNVNNTTCFETCESYLGDHASFVAGNAGRQCLVDVPSNHFDRTASPGSRLKSTLSSATGKCLNYQNGANCDQEYGQSHFDGFVRDLLDRGVREFEIDNEPMDWAITHGPASPALGPLNNDDFIQMEREASQRIGQIATGSPYSLPPGSFRIWAGSFAKGWDLGAGFSPSDLPANCSSSSCFVWKLMQQLCDAPATGISFHWYPEVYANNCRITGNCGDNAGVTWGRVNASRELWEPGFRASSSSLGVVSLFSNPHVLPWLRQVNASACPSRQFELAITEWRVGDQSVLDVWSVGLGTIDFLAGMGRAGVAEAQLWQDVTGGAAQQATYEAFKLFRRPDGTPASAVGGVDGGIMVRTDRNSDTSLRAYAYKGSDGTGLWVLLLNLDHAASTRTATVQLQDGVTASGTAWIYGTNRDGSVLMDGTRGSMPVSGSSFTLPVPSGSRLVHLPNVSGMRAVARSGCGAAPAPTDPLSATATHSPGASTVAQSVSASATVRNNGSVARTVNIQTMVKNASTGAQVGRTDCPNVVLQPNASAVCSHVATYPAGGYRTEVGIFSADWSTLYYWGGNLDQFTVVAATVNPTVRSGSISQASVCAGQPVSLAGVVAGGSTAGTYNIQLMLRNASGGSAGTFNCASISIGAGQTVSCGGTITPTQAGPLTLSAGVFNAAFTTMLDWRDSLASIQSSSCSPGAD